jgi:hypothetical protein
MVKNYHLVDFFLSQICASFGTDFGNAAGVLDLVSGYRQTHQHESN